MLYKYILLWSLLVVCRRMFVEWNILLYFFAGDPTNTQLNPLWLIPLEIQLYKTDHWLEHVMV